MAKRGSNVMHPHAHHMSCRQPATSCRGFQLLPQLSVTQEVVDFSLESSPPSLPPRNCATRVFPIVTVFSLFVVCGYLMFAKGDPNSTDLGTNTKHQREGLFPVSEDSWYTAQYRRLTSTEDEKKTPTFRAPGHAQKSSIRSSLLMRMASLSKREHALGTMDEPAVQRYFPDWNMVTAKQWNDAPELRDLVLAVSQLSKDSSFENELADSSR